MYLLSLILFMVLCVVFLSLLMGGGIWYFVDWPSMIILLLIVVPIVISSGLLKDFNNAFRFSVRLKEKVSEIALLRAKEAISLVINALWAAGIFSAAFSLIVALAMYKEESEIISVYVSVSIIPLAYAAFLVIILLPVKARLGTRLAMHGDTSFENAKETGKTEEEAQ